MQNTSSVWWLEECKKNTEIYGSDERFGVVRLARFGWEDGTSTVSWRPDPY